ncbi:MAG TPA: DUF1800 domain-containing protein [Solimonas sp.]|nr:DUF1800 domain-containing protein [Solimonas sp.]
MQAWVKGFLCCTALLCGSPAVVRAAEISEDEASRFLMQASFGPTLEDIAEVQRLGYAGWIDNQFSRAATLHRPTMEGPLGGISGEEFKPSDRQEAWFRVVLTANDQLRQRVAFALSEIFVIADTNNQINKRPRHAAEYYDVLLRHAFGNYRNLIEQVTLSPAMGLYLSMIRNDKPDDGSGRRPDENFAREAMQLFSIGVWELNADGSERLDGRGERIASYSQETVENFSRLYTGWNWADADSFFGEKDSLAAMKAFPEHHDSDSKRLLRGLVVPAGNTPQQDLDAAMDNLFQHPNTAPFISRRLIQRLVSSNPSPAYIQRVARVFENNGSGTRGDLRAVVRAILLDSEARAAPIASSGKLKEPLLRITGIWRAFDARSGSGRYEYPRPEADWGQAALRSPSVFNFFLPDYRPPGSFTQAGLYAPEFQIQTDTMGLRMANSFARFILRQYEGAPDVTDEQIVIRVAREAALAADPQALLDELDTLLLAGRMTPALRGHIASLLTQLPASDPGTRAVSAIYLVATSPEYAVQK